jgi:hypothetical protein
VIHVVAQDDLAHRPRGAQAAMDQAAHVQFRQAHLGHDGNAESGAHHAERGDSVQNLVVGGLVQAVLFKGVVNQRGLGREPDQGLIGQLAPTQRLAPGQRMLLGQYGDQFVVEQVFELQCIVAFDVRANRKIHLVPGQQIGNVWRAGLLQPDVNPGCVLWKPVSASVTKPKANEGNTANVSWPRSRRVMARALLQALSISSKPRRI